MGVYSSNNEIETIANGQLELQARLLLLRLKGKNEFITGMRRVVAWDKIIHPGQGIPESNPESDSAKPVCLVAKRLVWILDDGILRLGEAALELIK